MTSPALQVTYTIRPPLNTPLPSLPSTATHLHPLQTGSGSAQEQLIALEQALGAARERLNQELTVWKDAVKGLELEVRGKKGKSSTEEEGEEDEEEEEE